MPMISREELDRLMRMAKNYINPPEPRPGYRTIALYDELNASVMRNLNGLLEAADRGVGALMRHDGRGSSLMSNPTEADMKAFGASHEACYRWPEDTPEHTALRAAFCDGAAGAGDEIERLRAAMGEQAEKLKSIAATLRERRTE